MFLINPLGRMVEVDMEEVPNLLTKGFKSPSLGEFYLVDDVKGKSVLLHRKTGGLGDIVTLLPAVDSLSKIAKVTLAIPSIYFFIFKDSKITLLDFNDYKKDVDFYKSSNDYTINLFCPCGLHEEKNNFSPIESRIENFAEALNVKPSTPIFKQPKSTTEEVKILFQLKTMNAHKDWPLEYFEQLANFLSKNYSVYSLDKTRSIPSAIPITGKELNEIPSILADFTLVIGGDSGLMHLASSMNIPTLWLFGPTSRDLTLKFYPKAVGLTNYNNLSCSAPCYYAKINGFKCESSIGLCMLQITPREVARKVIKMVSIIKDYEGKKR